MIQPNASNLRVYFVFRCKYAGANECRFELYQCLSAELEKVYTYIYISHI